MARRDEVGDSVIAASAHEMDELRRAHPYHNFLPSEDDALAAYAAATGPAPPPERQHELQHDLYLKLLLEVDMREEIERALNEVLGV